MTAKAKTAKAPTTDDPGRLEHVPLAKIAVDAEHNPRRRAVDEGDAFAELVASVEHHGVLQPILLREHVGNDYVVVAGHRRLAAATAASLPTIPAYITGLATDPEGAFAAAVVENTARDDLNPLEQAQAITRLLEGGKSQAEVAKMLSKSERWVRERLRILKLPADAQRAIGTGEIPSTVARVLEQIAEPTPRLAAAVVKALKAGDITAADLLADDLRTDALGDLVWTRGHGDDDTDDPLPAVQLGGSHHVADLPLTSDQRDHIERILRDGKVQVDRTYVPIADDNDFRLLAHEAGKLLNLESKGFGGAVQHYHYVDDPELIYQAAVKGAEHLVAEHAARLKEAAKQKKAAEKAAANGEGPTAREAARKARDAEHAEIEANAVVPAQTMNHEVGDVVRRHLAGRPEGDAARLVLELALANHGTRHLVAIGEALTSPAVLEQLYGMGAPKGSHPSNVHLRPELQAITDAYRQLEPDQGAGRLVQAVVAAALVDQRVLQGHARQDVRDLLGDRSYALVLAIAEQLPLPDRVHKLIKARDIWRDALVRNDTQAARRRILHELADTAGGKLEIGELTKRAGAYKYSPELHDRDIAHQVYDRGKGDLHLEPELRVLQAEGHVTLDRDEAGDAEGRIRTDVVITDAGRAYLQAPPEQVPVFPAIDAAPAPAPEPTPPGKSKSKGELPATQRTQPLQKVADALSDALTGGEGGLSGEQLHELLGDDAWARAIADDGKGGAAKILKRVGVEPPPTPDDAVHEHDLPGAEPDAPAPANGKTGTVSERALAAIIAKPGITIPELAQELAVKQNALYRVVPALMEQGDVIKSGRGWHPAGAQEG